MTVPCEYSWQVMALIVAEAAFCGWMGHALWERRKGRGE